MKRSLSSLLRIVACLCMSAGLALAPHIAHAAAVCSAGQWVANPNDTDMPAVRYETTHFAFRWEDAEQVPRADLEAAGKELELIWNTYINRIRFPEPYCASATKYKVSIYLKSDFGMHGGVTDSGGMGMWVSISLLQDHWDMAHELTHALQGASGGLTESEYTGWIWESHANWMAHQIDEYHNTEVHCSTTLVNYPHLYLGSTRDRYCNWQFMEYLKDRFGYSIINDMWAKAPKSGDPGLADADPFSVIRDNMGWTQSQLNDVFGDWAMHNVNWDYTDPDGRDHGVLMREQYGSNDAFDPENTADWNNRDLALRLTQLDQVPGQERRYRVPFDWAPQRWGYNLVRLIPAAGAAAIGVKFAGDVQTQSAVNVLPGLDNDPSAIALPDSDWRWGVVAIDAAGKARYSPLQRGASASLQFDLKRGDTGLYLVVMGTPSKMHKIKWDQSYYSIYRYPWSVTLDNAYPSGRQPNAPTPTALGTRHANGGGWVARNAYVAPTAYVGPDARVLGGQVLGNARIQDHATIMGGTVQDNVVVGGLSVVHDGATIRDSAQVHTVFMGPGAFEAFTLSGNAQLRGDAEERGASPSKGVFYGYVDPGLILDPEYGADLTGAVPEVTATPRSQ
ncbi:avirulence protein [Xanthomonas cerealis pv. cerealis]|uniref:Avirulence protein n=1 Tax=Xanthomonas cerealis pv. cerealis TaxID=152263 RepID=A0A514EDB5_9XANT|nr:Svx/AvrXca family virulence/avirulence protein [Xanthomonas translucens]QDI04004.1 avirulence protein [Xanthomonas translucens pv. cerealis]UKE68330.1 Svx/AvrXca family virulence/avirulence protein [Xanthomonas translucens pv. pistacia]